MDSFKEINALRCLRDEVVELANNERISYDTYCKLYNTIKSISDDIKVLDEIAFA